jgi:DNA polymerase-3 subunit beta
MRVNVNFEKFKKEISKALNACMKTGQAPNLKGIFLEANSGMLTIRSTNIDIGFESSLTCKVEIEGKFLISGDVISRLLSTVSVKSRNNCEIIYEDNVCNINIDQHNFKLKTLSFENFPNLPKVEGVEISVDNRIFLSGLRSVIYSVAKSEIKPEISGIFVKFIENNLFFVATDAYRLSEKKVNIEEEVAEIGFIIPEKNVKELLKIIDNDYTGNLSLTISKNSLQIKENDTYLVSRLIDGNFPNYQQIIPSAPVSFAIFLKEDLVKSLKIVSFFSDKTQQINLNIGENSTEMEASNTEVGSTKETLNSTLKGDPFTVKLNSKYLEEFLQSISDSSVVLKFTAQNKAIIVQGLQDANYTYLLMPSYR